MALRGAIIGAQERMAATSSLPQKTAPWASRIVGYGEEAPDQLLAFPGNPKIHPRAQQIALDAAISELGWLAPVICNRVTGHVLDGHARISLAISRGEATVPVAYVELPSDQEALALATFDPIGGLAVHDKDALDALLKDVTTTDETLRGFLEDFAKSNGVGFGAPNELAADDQRDELTEQYQVLVRCTSERQQAELLERLTQDGFSCRALLS